MQSSKVDMAATIADGDAKNFVEALQPSLDAYNKRPHGTMYAAPDNVEDMPTVDFRVLQDNAMKSLLNQSSQLHKSQNLKAAGAFRAPIASKRSFEPRFGDVQLLGKPRKGDPNDMVRNRGGGTFLLKEIQAVVPESGKSAGTLTEKNLPRKIRMQEHAGDLEEHIREAGSRMLISDLERQVRRGGVGGLLKALRRNRMTLKSFLKLYKQMFKTAGGYVEVKTETVPTTQPDEPLAAQIARSDARNAMLKEARLQTSKERLRGLSSVYRGL